MKTSQKGTRAAAPEPLPDTVPTDHESIYISGAPANACQREGITMRPGQPITGYEKGQLERHFRTLREAMP